MNRVSSWLLGCVAFGLSLSGMAADTAATSALKPELRAKLASKIPGAKPENIRETPIPGLYEVSVVPMAAMSSVATCSKSPPARI
jgi:Disulfide bond isomerase protein N-terminus